VGTRERERERGREREGGRDRERESLPKGKRVRSELHRSRVAAASHGRRCNVFTLFDLLPYLLKWREIQQSCLSGIDCQASNMPCSSLPCIPFLPNTTSSPSSTLLKHHQIPFGHQLIKCFCRRCKFLPAGKTRHDRVYVPSFTPFLFTLAMLRMRQVLEEFTVESISRRLRRGRATVNARDVLMPP